MKRNAIDILFEMIDLIRENFTEEEIKICEGYEIEFWPDSKILVSED